MAKFVLKTALLLATTILTVGCGYNISRDELIGNYKVTYSYGTEELALLNDGHYEQRIVVSGDTSPAIHSGQWDFSGGERAELVLHDALIVDDGFGKPNKEYRRVARGVRGIRASKSFGKLKLSINEDLDQAFERAQP